MRWFKLAVAAYALVTTPASARNLMLIGATFDANERGAMFLDADTIRDVGSYKRAWIFSGYKGKTGEPATAAILTETDCSQERMRTVQIDFYKPDGSHDSKGNPESWSFPTPSTNNYIAMQFICDGKGIPEDQKFGDRDPFETFRRYFNAK